MQSPTTSLPLRHATGGGDRVRGVFPLRHEVLSHPCPGVRVRRLETSGDRDEDFGGRLQDGTENLCVFLAPTRSIVTFDGSTVLGGQAPLGSLGIPDGTHMAGTYRGALDFLEFRVASRDLPELLSEHDMRARTRWSAGGLRPGYAPADDLFDRRIRHLAVALDGVPRVDVLYFDTLLEACLGHLLRRHVDAEQVAVRRRPSLAPTAMRRVADFIEAHIDASLRLDELARVAGVSRAHFARAFHAETGVTPHRYVMHRRIEAALGLMKRRSLPLETIARLTGFADHAHLTRTFRHQLGITPSAARHAQRRRRWAADHPA